MSELRDLTAVFRALQASIQEIGEHVASQEAHAEQLRKGLHELKNTLAVREGLIDSLEVKLTQVHTWMGDFDRKQKEMSDSVKALGQSITDHRREINGRIKNLEPQEEVTRP